MMPKLQLPLLFLDGKVLCDRRSHHHRRLSVRGRIPQSFRDLLNHRFCFWKLVFPTPCLDRRNIFLKPIEDQLTLLKDLPVSTIPSRVFVSSYAGARDQCCNEQNQKDPESLPHIAQRTLLNKSHALILQSGTPPDSLPAVTCADAQNISDLHSRERESSSPGTLKTTQGLSGAGSSIYTPNAGHHPVTACMGVC